LNSVSEASATTGVEGDRTANALNLFVQKRPFIALMIAVGAGYIGARVLRNLNRQDPSHVLRSSR
jgi:hypothetical protein